jgi:hypothetical protein
VDLERLHPPADPEFRSHRPGLLASDLDGEPEAYLRLVANPFLALLYLVAWLVALYESVIEGFGWPLTPMLVVSLLAGLGLVPFLMEYHCLDCGRTGRLTRWQKHLCPHSLARREAGRRRRLRGPSPPVQVALWLCVVMGLALVINALDLPHRIAGS